MMVKFAGEFVTVLGAGEQFQRSFPSCFRYERLGKSRFVRVHACTVTPQTKAATQLIGETSHFRSLRGFECLAIYRQRPRKQKELARGHLCVRPIIAIMKRR